MMELNGIFMSVLGAIGAGLISYVGLHEWFLWRDDLNQRRDLRARMEE